MPELTMLDISPGEYWYLVQCKPRHESYAAEYMRGILHLSVYLPERQIRSRSEVRRTPLFPGYLFLSVNLHRVPLSQINTSPGVLRLVMFGNSLDPIPQYVIDAIESQLAYLNGVAPSPPHGLRYGDRVRMKYGPLQDLDMMFVGTTTPGTRVRVLLELLGRLKETQVDVAMLEKVSSSSPLRQETRSKGERRTRGRGRTISTRILSSES